MDFESGKDPLGKGSGQEHLTNKQEPENSHAKSVSSSDTHPKTSTSSHDSDLATDTRATTIPPSNTNPKTDPASDRLLFRRISEGDESAFRDIFHAYRKILYPVVLSLVKVEADAKEILQETFLKLWLKRETLAEIESPGGWLYSVASTEALMHLRKESRYARRLQKASAETKVNADQDLKDIHEQFDSKEVKILIAEAVEKLPLRRRQVFQMSRLEGYSRKEIAETLGISENTVRNRLVEAVESIQDYIRKNSSIYLPAVLVMFLIK